MTEFSLLSSVPFHPSVIINTLHNTQNYKCFSINKTFKMSTMQIMVQVELKTGTKCLLFSSVTEHSRAEIKTHHFNLLFKVVKTEIIIFFVILFVNSRSKKV